MAVLTGDIATLVCKPQIDPEMGEVVLNGRMLQFLMKLDGSKDLGSMAETLGLDLNTAKEISAKLLDFKLISIIGGSEPMLPESFFDFITERLALIAGPIAQLMVEDAIQDLGGKKREIPKNKAIELIDIFSRQISDDEQRAVFIQVVMKKLNEIN
ncbi:MAG: hypothetical protein J7L69_09040 [Desulfobulbaceae bacterium]|nr:hypothetical protein [Desulfobulbaceae bacterium]